MKLLLSKSSVVVCLNILLLAGCGPTPVATPVAVLPTATSTVPVSAAPTSTSTLTPTTTPTPTTAPSTRIPRSSDFRNPKDNRQYDLIACRDSGPVEVGADCYITLNAAGLSPFLEKAGVDDPRDAFTGLEPSGTVEIVDDYGHSHTVYEMQVLVYGQPSGLRLLHYPGYEMVLVPYFDLADITVPTPEPTSVTWAIDPYVDGIDPALRQPILDTFLAEGMVSPREVRLLRALTIYPHRAQRQIVDAGLVDEYYASSRTAEQILDDLSTPHVVVFYLAQFFTYEPQVPVVYLRALPAIELGSGGCIRYAQIGAEALLGNGYTPFAWNMVINITDPRGHNVTLFMEPDDGEGLLSPGEYYVITNGEGVRGRLGNGAVLLGPFSTAYEAGLDVQNRGYTPPGEDFRVLQNTFDLNSPWVQVSPSW